MKSYTNPVYPHYFADPFVWRHEGTYYAIGTGPSEAPGRAFPLLRSDDMAHWEAAGFALEHPAAELGDTFWAPEVAYEAGIFYLYYSVGFGDKGHQLRVATSSSPLGPYRDAGVALIPPAECPFAIDAHPFKDDDGRWYLFFARDFLDETTHLRAGTALAVVQMKNMTSLEPETMRVVVRARYDWQRFLANRSMYGRTFDWHTLEGPTVRKHDGRYYCFYSGGCWENESYGVDYVVADQPLGPYREVGKGGAPRVLKTRPGAVLGPGHNSITVGPDGRSEYFVYHAWDPARSARRMFLDRLAWTPDGPRCEGPTLTPQAL